MSSIKPNDSCGEIDGTEEVSRCFVISGCDGAVLFQPGKEVFDQMPSFVEMFVVRALHVAVCPGRDDDLFTRVFQWLNDPFIRIMGFIGNHGLRRDVGQQRIGTFQVTGLPRREVKSGGIAQGIDGGMDLHAQPATAAPDGLLFFFMMLPARQSAGLRQSSIQQVYQ